MSKKLITRPTVYYAHAKHIYHTAEEKKQLEHIKRKFPDHIILNPRDHQDYPQDDVMGYYKKLVGSCDRVVFSRLAGKITAGVGVEVNHALSLGMQVHELTLSSLSL